MSVKTGTIITEEYYWRELLRRYWYGSMLSIGTRIYKYMHTDLTGTPPDRGRNALQGPRQGESCAPC